MSRKTYIVTYVTENNDLYHEEFSSKAKAECFIDEDIQDLKAQLFVIEGTLVEVEDRT